MRGLRRPFQAQQIADIVFRDVVMPFAEMGVNDLPLRIDQVMRGPVLVVVIQLQVSQIVIDARPDI